MEIFVIVLIMLGTIGVSNVINRFIPFVPVPLIQIALGVGLASITSLIEHMELNPELFFVLFIAPLLFNDGKRTPRDELWNLRAPILLLALGLVLATVIIVGPFIHWLIPEIPIAAAFALAAILSPTDAVAVSSIAGRVRLPVRIIRLLEGEALMNDASGLVSFKFAIAAAVTGVFSITQATYSFAVISIGGILAGIVLAFMLVWLRVFIRRLGIVDVTVHMLILIMTPFLIYLIAEELHVSGILAVVIGGIVHAVERDRTEAASTQLRVVSDSIWSILVFIFNGLVFIILGLEIPDVVSVIFKDPMYSNGIVIGYILLITAVLLLLRFVWVYVFAAEHTLRTSLITALSGVRGAVTLAGAFSIPLVIAGGNPFPQRNLIIFLSAGVILLTLIIASVLLPLIARQSKEESPLGEDAAECMIQMKVMEVGLNAVRENMTQDNSAASLSVIADYHKQLQWVSSRMNGGLIEMQKITVEFRMKALQVEQETGRLWLEEGRVTAKTARQFQYILSQIELVLSNRLKFLVSIAGFAIRSLFDRNPITKDLRRMTQEDWAELKELKLQSVQDAIKALREDINDRNRDAVLLIIDHYREIEARINSGTFLYGKVKEELKTKKRDIQLKAMQTERNMIQEMYEKGEIDRATTSKLRIYLNYREASMFEDEHIETQEA